MDIIKNFNNYVYEIVGYASGNIGAFRKIISEYLDCANNVKTLDYGCGTGLFCKSFDRRGYLGVDLSEERIVYAQKKYSEYKFENLKNISFDESLKFDNILCLGVLHHMDNQSVIEIMHKFNKMLNSGGKILAIEPTQTGFFLKDTFIKIMDRGAFVRRIDEYKNLMDKSFNVVVSEIHPPLISRLWSSDYVYCMTHNECNF